MFCQHVTSQAGVTRMARPLRTSKPSDERVQVRLSRKEKARLYADAAKAKMTVSDYVRHKTGVDRAEA
jgi:hypothetical protein